MTDLPSPGGWDEVVVGAGSSGAVLASRLSEHPDRRVLLVEAGAGQIDVDEAGKALGTSVLDGANWHYEAYLGDVADGRRYPYRVGKVVGGSSAVNAAIALRGLPSDFDGWAGDNPEWAWHKVLPYFVRLESDADVKGPAHGTDGPVPIRRVAPAEFDPTAEAFLRACRALGLPDLPDLNGGGEVGVGPVPSNASGQRRVSVADAYLAPARQRPNLTVWARCQATRVLVRGGRVTGVEMIRGGRLSQVPAGRVTLCAGAVNTPAILQRSGIGPADVLEEAGITPIAELPGVGANLADHPVLAMWMVPKPGVCQRGAPLHQVMARAAGAGETSDLAVFLASNVSEVAIPLIADGLRGRLGVAVTTMLLTPQSRGSVVVRDPDPDGEPEITLRLVSAPADVERLVAGVRLAWSIVRAAPFAELLERVLVWTDRIIGDENMLRRAVAAFATPMWHPAGTARMGPATDGMAVVDQHLRVHQIENLRIVDASVLPSIPAAPTNLTCIMLAERAAEWMD